MPSAALAPADVAELLGSWHKLNDGILHLSEAALRQLLLVELQGQRRKRFLDRLHHRFNRVRLLRERQQMSDGEMTWLQS